MIFMYKIASLIWVNHHYKTDTHKLKEGGTLHTNY